MEALWRKLLVRFFARFWFPKFKWKKDRIREAMLETAREDATENKSPRR